MILKKQLIGRIGLVDVMLLCLTFWLLLWLEILWLLRWKLGTLLALSVGLLLLLCLGFLLLLMGTKFLLVEIVRALRQT